MLRQHQPVVSADRPQPAAGAVLMKPCKDCVAEGLGTKRPAPHPGPRCATHHRARRKAVKARSHELRVRSVYGLPPGFWEALYEAQGRGCAVCGRPGLKRKLSVDHDHACCPGPTSCGKCVRGLACRVCNDFIGYLRDSPAAFARGCVYLADPPAKALLATWEGTTQ